MKLVVKNLVTFSAFSMMMYKYNDDYRARFLDVKTLTHKKNVQRDTFLDVIHKFMKCELDPVPISTTFSTYLMFKLGIDGDWDNYTTGFVAKRDVEMSLWILMELCHRLRRVLYDKREEVEETFLAISRMINVTKMTVNFVKMHNKISAIVRRLDHFGDFLTKIKGQKTSGKFDDNMQIDRFGYMPSIPMDYRSWSCAADETQIDSLLAKENMKSTQNLMDNIHEYIVFGLGSQQGSADPKCRTRIRQTINKIVSSKNNMTWENFSGEFHDMSLFEKIAKFKKCRKKMILRENDDCGSTFQMMLSAIGFLRNEMEVIDEIISLIIGYCY
jgi:hypothetical protein